MATGVLFSAGLAIFVVALLQSGSDLDFSGRAVYSTYKTRGHASRRRNRV